MMGRPPRLIEVGETFGRLTATSPRRGIQDTRIQCVCECGNEVDLPFKSWGRTESCGCARLIRWDLAEVQRRITVDEDGCWIWNAKKQYTGYALIKSGSAPSTGAHRFVYALLVGPIPEGHDLDHQCHTLDETCPGGWTCKHRACVNPEHLAPMLPIENTMLSRQIQAQLAKTHCPKGHPYSGWNLIEKYGRRYCRACIYAGNYRRKRAAREAKKGRKP